MEDWLLKIERANKHMIDIKEETGRYASTNPYTIERVGWPDSDNKVRYRFRITEQPNPMIAVMLGDFIHNLRSALDYIIVACAPKKYRKSAGFPIVFQDIFAKDKNGEFVVKDTEMRDNFNRAIRGLHLCASAFVISLQPYQEGHDIDCGILGIIGRIENADKHRELVTIGCGGKNCSIAFNIAGLDRILNGAGQFVKDDTIITHTLPIGGIPPIKPSDMEMHLTSTIEIMVEITRTEGNLPPIDMSINEIMDMALWNTKGIIKRLERFVVN